jgi:hypothetical protein
VILVKPKEGESYMELMSKVEKAVAKMSEGIKHDE